MQIIHFFNGNPVAFKIFGIAHLPDQLSAVQLSITEEKACTKNRLEDLTSSLVVLTAD